MSQQYNMTCTACTAHEGVGGRACGSASTGEAASIGQGPADKYSAKRRGSWRKRVVV